MMMELFRGWRKDNIFDVTDIEDQLTDRLNTFGNKLSEFLNDNLGYGTLKIKIKKDNEASFESDNTNGINLNNNSKEI